MSLSYYIYTERLWPWSGCESMQGDKKRGDGLASLQWQRLFGGELDKIIIVKFPVLEG